MEFAWGALHSVSADRLHRRVGCCTGYRVIQPQSREHRILSAYVCAVGRKEQLVVAIFSWTLDSMASAESLKILRSLQSRPENKVRDVTPCVCQVKEHRAKGS